uniref:Histone deacetylase complex subunit SAP18 n=1 Tax=Alexandrium catenella TaxID=2925 RepID=A0A7S1WME7_ALECA
MGPRDDRAPAPRSGPVSRPGPYARPAFGKGGGKGGMLTGSNTTPLHTPMHLKKVDRAGTCPFLLRVFHKIGGHHGIEAFAVRGKEPVDDELQVYTWPDVTLRELADLVKDVAPEARAHSARLNFRLIYPDKTGKNVATELGTVSSAKRGPDDEKRLSASKFQTGDLLDLAIYT